MLFFMLFPAVSEMPHLRSHSSLVPIYVFLRIYVSEGMDIAALVKAGEVCGGPPSRSSFLGNHLGTKLIPCNSEYWWSVFGTVPSCEPQTSCVHPAWGSGIWAWPSSPSHVFILRSQLASLVALANMLANVNNSGSGREPEPCVSITIQIKSSELSAQNPNLIWFGKTLEWRVTLILSVGKGLNWYSSDSINRPGLSGTGHLEHFAICEAVSDLLPALLMLISINFTSCWLGPSVSILCLGGGSGCHASVKCLLCGTLVIPRPFVFHFNF